MNEKTNQLSEMIQKSNNIVFFGGAGVSTESGIPDFRSVDGLYNQKYKYPPEQILSGSFFKNHPEEFYNFYRDKLVTHDVKPNQAHIRLSELEKEGKLVAIITQNIDELHQAAGSQNVLELHGTIHRFYCTSCGKAMSENEVITCDGVPHCICGGIVRPDVVLYEEQLNANVLKDAMRFISECDMMIVGGTSLNVYPAAGLLTGYKGKKLVLINKQPTPYDKYANLVINEKIGEVFAQV